MHNSLMNAVEYFTFPNLDKPIRADLPEAFRSAWTHIAAPGSGWSSAERVAIAVESRRAESCALCAERKKAVSSNAVQAEHDSVDLSPKAATDAVHRISTDAERLSKSYYEQTLNDGVTNSQWVEIVGIVSTLKSIDDFHRALGLPLEPLPESSDVSATGYRPEGLSQSGGWLPMLQVADLAEPEKMLYEGYPRTANVLRAMSCVPSEVRNLNVVSDAM